MKKVIALTIIAATLLSLLAGCGASTAPGPGSDLTADKIFDNFEEIFISSEMAEHYSLTRLPETPIPETGETLQSLVVTDNLTEDTYHLSVVSMKKGGVRRAFFSHHYQNYSYLAFPTFCLYLVRALELTEVDGMEICNTLNLLSEAPEGRMKVESWELWAFNKENLLTLTADYEVS